MYRSSLLLSFLLAGSVSAKEFSEDKYLHIIGNDLEVKDNVVRANGDVVLYTPSYYITAQKLMYDRNNSKIELFDGVSILKGKEFTSYSEYALMDMANENNKMEPFLLLDNQTNLWFSSSSSKKEKDNYQLKDATLSSCDCGEPSWSVSFDEGDYNTTKKWVNIYNATLYIKDTPILYTPYFAFPTDKTRRTGLLQPTLGYSSNEGIMYAQPLYYAPKPYYDFEYIPQYRSKRGSGHALKFRYKDSPYSQLKFETGLFKEKKSYQEEMNLENDKHYGWDIEYKRDKLFSRGEDADGLILKSLDMNDVDYINTLYDNNTYDDETDKFLESQLKYYYNTNRYYADLDIKLYNDISKSNNDDVMQTLPSINLHKYRDTIFLDDLSYSLDLEYVNKTRDVGIGANTLNLTLPVTYHRSFFNEFFNLSLTEEVKFSSINYTNNNLGFEDARYGENNHIVSIYTDLIKPYSDNIHNVRFDATLTYGNSFLSDGDIYGINTQNANLNTFELVETKKELSLGFSQSLYSKGSLKELFTHKLNQTYDYDELAKDYKRAELENDITLYHKYGSLSNRIKYDHTINEFVNSTTTLKLKYEDYFFNINHKNSKDSVTLVNSETVNYDLGFDFNKYYSLRYKEEYDLSDDISKKKEYILDIDKKCWGINFKLADSLVATNTTTDSALRQNILYIEFNLKQFFKMDQVHKFDVRNQ